MSMLGSGFAFARLIKVSRSYADPRPHSGVRLDLRSRERNWTACEGMAIVEGFRGDILIWVQLDRKGRIRALPPTRSILVSVAGAGSSDRQQHRRRFPTLQQIVQLLLFGARSLGHSPCGKFCSKAF